MHAQQETRILVDLAEESDEIYKFIIFELSHTRMSAIAMKKSNLSVSDGISHLESSHNVNQNDLSEEESEPPQQNLQEKEMKIINRFMMLIGPAA
ncbi:hypothetical protein P8452_71363 [Trifolium repens]|nr:hypothetical protein P8452_71363 [Trifolium repens]